MVKKLIEMLLTVVLQFILSIMAFFATTDDAMAPARITHVESCKVAVGEIYHLLDGV